MRVLVCGSRTWSDDQAVWDVLGGLDRAHGIEALIQGAAVGADRCAVRWAGANKVEEFCEFPADWKKYGKGAGPVRNRQMIDEGKPDVVWAFVDKPLTESKGTADMVRRARAAGIPTYVVEKS